MSRTNQRVARKPATKLPSLRKKMQKNKVQAQKAKKKGAGSGMPGAGRAPGFVNYQP